MSSWIDEITDPSEVEPAELYNALAALAIELEAVKTADGIEFIYDDSFFSELTTTVDEALKEIGDYLYAGEGLRQLVEDFTTATLVDATSYFHFLMARDRVLGLVVLKTLTTPPSTGDLVINILKNGALIDTVTILNASAGAVYLDLSHTTVVLGDVITVVVVTAEGAVGLLCSLEV